MVFEFFMHLDFTMFAGKMIYDYIKNKNQAAGNVK